MPSRRLTLSKPPDPEAPGPDGFCIGFYINCWDILKKDFAAMTREFELNLECIKLLDSTIVVLISNCSYTIITKILARRLSK